MLASLIGVLEEHLYFYSPLITTIIKQCLLSLKNCVENYKKWYYCGRGQIHYFSVLLTPLGHFIFKREISTITLVSF